MSNYLFVNSRDPFGEKSLEKNIKIMSGLLEKEHGVQLMLVQDAVYAAQKEVDNGDLKRFIDKGGKVYVDDFSLKLRELSPGALEEGVVINPISILVDALKGKYKVIWN